MSAQWFTAWILVIVATVLAGWWLTVRPRACYRGVATPVSFLIFVAAALMFLLALSGQGSRGAHSLRTVPSAAQLR